MHSYSIPDFFGILCLQKCSICAAVAAAVGALEPPSRAPPPGGPPPRRRRPHKLNIFAKKFPKNTESVIHRKSLDARLGLLVARIKDPPLCQSHAGGMKDRVQKLLMQDPAKVKSAIKVALTAGL